MADDVEREASGDGVGVDRREGADRGAGAVRGAEVVALPGGQHERGVGRVGHQHAHAGRRELGVETGQLRALQPDPPEVWGDVLDGRHPGSPEAWWLPPEPGDRIAHPGMVVAPAVPRTTRRMWRT